MGGFCYRDLRCNPRSTIERGSGNRPDDTDPPFVKEENLASGVDADRDKPACV